MVVCSMLQSELQLCNELDYLVVSEAKYLVRTRLCVLPWTRIRVVNVCLMG